MVGPVLEELQREFDGTARGGRIFRLVVEAWKSGTRVGSNKEIAEAAGWDLGQVADGFRLVRERLGRFAHAAVRVELAGYTKELVVTAKGGVGRTGGLLLLSVGGRRAEIAGQLLAGAAAVAQGRGLRLVCETPADAEAQARGLGEGYDGYLVYPVDETDDFGALARLGRMAGRAALLDIAARHGAAPCVTFDYAGVGLYATGQLIELGCRTVVVLAREGDSRTYAMAEGYRRAMRRAGLAVERVVMVDDTVEQVLAKLQARGLFGEKLGLLCADGEFGAEVLTYLDRFEAGRWDVAVGVVGGRRWSARHWAEVVWVDLDYAELAAAGARYLLGTQGGATPQVTPRYEQWIPRKPAGSAGEGEVWKRSSLG